ncbi:ABC transporter ATP-binding protein [Nocardia sp. NPDC050412]|uniref:ABC transporter ATP-binding protein n=1 Tax=Nocardia sp. NPDC050412 TaxID=3364320 RepID=UPI0037B43579
MGWMRRLWTECWSHRGTVTGIAIALVAGAVVEISAPLLTKRAVDAAGVGDTSVIGTIAALLALVALGRFSAAFGRRMLAGRLSLDVQHSLRVSLLASLQRLDGVGQDALRTGQVVSRSITDLQLVQGLLAMVPLSGLALLEFLLAAAVMVWLSPPLAAVALLVVPAIAVLVYRMRPRLYAATWSAQQRAAEVAQHVEETVTGVRVVKGFGQEARMVRVLEEHGRVLYAERMRAAKINARFAPVVTTIPQAGLVAVIVVGGLLALHGVIGIGTFLAFSAYVTTMTVTTRTMSSVVIMAQLTRAAAERVYQVIDAAPEIADPPAPADLPDGPLGIEIDSLTFGFDPSQPILRDLDLTVRPGETVAIIGPAGSGKSTLSLLLPRFYAPDSGSIRLFGAEPGTIAGEFTGAKKRTVDTADSPLAAPFDPQLGGPANGSTVRADPRNADAVDIADLRATDLRSAIGVVFDDPFLFSDTIAANIALGRPAATDAEIRYAAKLAAADEFITELSDGYDTVVGERGLTLSGGQRQRIALARALLARPRILVLDDATSAVDAVTEAAIFEKLPDVGGRTTLILAHRESTLAHADRVIRLPGPVSYATGEATGADTQASADAKRTTRTTATGAARTATISSARTTATDPEPTTTTGAAHTTTTGAAHTTTTGSAHTTATDPEPTTATGAAHTTATDPGRTTAIGAGRTTGFARAATPTSGPGGFSGAAADLSETPELRRTIEHLPPATEQPGSDDEQLRQPDPGFRLARLLRPVRWLVLAVITLLALDTLIGVAFPPIVRYAIDSGVSGHDSGALARAGVLGAVLVVLGLAVGAATTVLTARTGERVLYGLRVRSYAHLQRLGLDYYERELSGRIMTRMTTDVDALSTFLQTGVATTLIGLLTLVGIAVALLVIDASLAAVVLIALPPLLVATALFRRVSSTAYTVSREHVSTVNADFQENVAGLRAVQANRHEPIAARRFAEYSDRYRASRMRAQRAIAMYFAFVIAWADLALAAVVYFGAREVAENTMTAGTLIAFVLYLQLLFGPILQLSQVFDGYQQARVGLRRIGDLLRTPSSIATDPPDAIAIDHGLRGEVVLDDIRFHYPSTEKPALDGVSLRIPAGSTLALVGPTGAGKSTIVKLLARLYDLPRDTQGAIAVDDIDIRDYRLTDYRGRLGIVPQEAHLFTGDVASNIAFGKPSATEAEIAAAATAVGAADMIAALPQGMRHPIGERGRGLSAGQRQLIALARAELVRPDLLLLDEATATLDPETEASVLVASRSLTRGRTTIVVAHRLGTAARADRIAVVERGRIAEIGPHDTLVAAGGPYAQLWAAASETGGIFSGEDGSSSLGSGLSGGQSIH